LLTWSLSGLTFVKQAVGTTSPPQFLSLTNPNGVAVAISAVTTKGPFAVAGGGTCGTSLPGLTSCTIAVTFTPTAKGPVTGTLVITDDAEKSPQKIGLSGTGK
jgi:hypothetical protein